MADIDFGVARLSQPFPGVAQITMCDAEHGNTFTPALMDAVKRAFADVGKDESIKSVVLTGYGNYFASGSTQEDLVRMLKGEINFLHLDYFNLPMECPVPVVAAMQGHGIGGGFVLGLYADATILGRESVYTCNFMRYGFTPGIGSTYLVPHKLGQLLGTEMLYSARNYRGDEIAKRCPEIPVYPRSEVLDRALELARSFAEKPRLSLVTLKAQLTKHLCEKLPAVIQRELEMHDVTFRSPEVAENIHRLFGQ